MKVNLFYTIDEFEKLIKELRVHTNDIREHMSEVAEAAIRGVL